MSADRDDLRARLAALALDEAKLRKVLEDVMNGTEPTLPDEPEAIRGHVVDIAAELRVLLDTLGSHRKMLEDSLRSKPSD